MFVIYISVYVDGRLRAVPVLPLEFFLAQDSARQFAMSFRGSTNSREKIGTARSLVDSDTHDYRLCNPSNVIGSILGLHVTS